jgi:chitin disaccharide deacetylase
VQGAGRCLIVNADDFGLSPGVNSGVIKALERGIVTSASLMVGRSAAAAEAAAYAKANRGFSLGLHVDLGEWTFQEETWEPAYEVVALEDPSAVEAEVRRQLDSFRRLVGRDPTHLDSHQHVHTSDVPAEVLRNLARELGGHLRHNSSRIRYSGHFHGQTGTGAPLRDTITVDGLTQILRGLPPGITELGCHPGEGADVESAYREEREIELEVLCDPRIRATIEDEQIVLCSFADVALR